MSDSSQDEALPPHEVLEEISSGLLGVVYRARDPLRDAIVCLRAATVPEPKADAATRFLREARAAARLRLPYILPVYAAGMYGGRPCFTTMLGPEARLSEQRGRFAEPRAAADLVEKLAYGVAAAHAHGQVHGYLRSSAVLLDADGQPLIDFFDLLFFLHSATGEQPTMKVGDFAPEYLAPEQIAGPSPGVGPAADVWALGFILYELLTGRNPFPGPIAAPIPTAAFFRCLSDTPVPPRLLRRDIDRELEAVVLRCLQKKPDDRYGSVRALADDLERWLRAVPTEARRDPWWRRLLRAL